MRVTFVMEQQVGHKTFYRNLRRFIEANRQLTSTWVEVSYAQPGSLWNRLPGLPARIKGTLIGRAQVRRGLRRTAYDVAFFNTQVPAAISGRLARRQPYVLCTDITPVQYDQMGRHYAHRPDTAGWLASHKHRLNRGLFQQAARILAWSSWTKLSLVTDYGQDPDKIEVLPPGVDLETWRPRLLRPEGPLRVLFVGGDLTRKGGDDLIRAFRSLPAGLTELVMVTRSPLPNAEDIQIIRDMEPNSPELIALCQSCDVFVLPSYAEAFGIAAIEASALGLPVIATRVGGLTDIVVDQENGFLIQPGDWPMLAQHLYDLASDTELRRRLGQAARRRAEVNFDARQNAIRLGRILYETTAADGI